jgi:hypothetical protein
VEDWQGEFMNGRLGLNKNSSLFIVQDYTGKQVSNE